LSILAPAGLLGLRASFAPDARAEWLWTELSTYALTYGYLLAYGVVVLAFLGYCVGRRHDELELSCTTDSLTGLPNRRLFVQRVQEEARRAVRYQVPVSLLLIDLDDFKHINDTHGHAVGDAVLRAVGECLRVTCRDTELAVRCGGDEFAVLAPETCAEDAFELARRVHAQLEKACAEPLGDAGLLSVSVSIGIADMRRAAHTTREALFEAADRALYVAKAAGKNRIVLAPMRGTPRRLQPSKRSRAASAG
jgi:diguanylate cyclase (GGDEF)-like protein